jgi:hypothetical protein
MKAGMAAWWLTGRILPLAPQYCCRFFAKRLTQAWQQTKLEVEEIETYTSKVSLPCNGRCVMRFDPSARFRAGALSILAGGTLLVLIDTRSLPAEEAAAPASEFRQLAPGLLSRSVFKSAAGDKLAVEIFDLMVGPGQSSEAITLSGAALLDVQGGQATLLVDGKAQRVQAGGVVPLAQSQQLAIDNSRAQRSFVARLILLSRPGG